MVENIRKGLQFYKTNLFTDDGLPKYFHNQLYPIDIHAIAYSIVTLAEFKAYDEDNIDLAKRIFTWSLKTMQSKPGYFFYQKKRLFINRILIYAVVAGMDALRDGGSGEELLKHRFSQSYNRHFGIRV